VRLAKGGRDFSNCVASAISLSISSGDSVLTGAVSTTGLSMSGVSTSSTKDGEGLFADTSRALMATLSEVAHTTIAMRLVPIFLIEFLPAFFEIFVLPGVSIAGNTMMLDVSERLQKDVCKMSAEDCQPAERVPA
jgi:hypothetical protein